jgi:hypothetical protein
VMEGIGEIQPGAQASQGLHHGGPVFQGEGGMAEQHIEHREHLGGGKAVVAPQHPLQFQGNGFGQKEELAGFDQLPGVGFRWLNWHPLPPRRSGPAQRFQDALNLVTKRQMATVDRLYSSEDQLVRARAFAGKRDPVWMGR